MPTPPLPTHEVTFAMDKYQRRVSMTIYATDVAHLVTKIKTHLHDCRNGHQAEFWSAGHKHTITRDRGAPDGFLHVRSAWRCHSPVADPDNCAGLLNPDPTQKGF